MKNKLFATISLLVVLALLAGCGATSQNAAAQAANTSSQPQGQTQGQAQGQTQGQQQGQPQGQGQGQGQPQGQAQGNCPPGGLPMPLQLALGMVQLDSTSTPLSAAQAAQLAPLWEKALELTKQADALQNNTQPGNGTSDGQPAKPEEMKAAFDAIRAVLSQEQQQAIQEMRLSPEDVQAIGKTLGVTLDLPAQRGAGGNPPAGQTNGAQSGGNQPVGTPGAAPQGVPCRGGMNGRPGDGRPNGAQGETNSGQPNAGGPGGQNMGPRPKMELPVDLIQAVIEFLDGKR